MLSLLSGPISHQQVPQGIAVCKMGPRHVTKAIIWVISLTPIQTFYLNCLGTVINSSVIVLNLKHLKSINSFVSMFNVISCLICRIIKWCVITNRKSKKAHTQKLKYSLCAQAVEVLNVLLESFEL